MNLLVGIHIDKNAWSCLSQYIAITDEANNNKNYFTLPSPITKIYTLALQLFLLSEIILCLCIISLQKLLNLT